MNFLHSAYANLSSHTQLQDSLAFPTLQGRTLSVLFIQSTGNYGTSLCQVLAKYENYYKKKDKTKAPALMDGERENRKQINK